MKQIWSNCYLHGVKTNAHGVGILLNNNFEHEVIECHKDKNGNYIQLYLKCSSMKINLINIYAPNHDNPEFFKEIKDLALSALVSRHRGVSPSVPSLRLAYQSKVLVLQ